MILSEGKLDIFYTSPTALVFFGLALLVVGLQARSSMRPSLAARVAKEKNNA
jgi:hypothetical protein